MWKMSLSVRLQFTLFRKETTLGEVLNSQPVQDAAKSDEEAMKVELNLGQLVFPS